jgi:hypothetical protein
MVATMGENNSIVFAGETKKKKKEKKGRLIRGTQESLHQKP